MKRLIPYVALAAVLAVGFGCAKKKTTKSAGPVGTAATAELKKFDEGLAAFKQAIKFGLLKPDNVKAADAAGEAEAAFGAVAQAWPKDPPDRFEGDIEWGTHIAALRKLMADIKAQVGSSKAAEAQASILEAQKILLALDEKNKVNTAGDEAIRLLVICAEMKLAFQEKRTNDMKHIMPEMWEAQKNFFGSTIPPAAKGREEAFDNAKDKVYEGVDTFAEAPNREARGAALDALITATNEFYVDFG